MATTIKIKRGLKTNLPTLAVGEMGYCTDTNELFIGTDTGNVLINEGTQKVGQPVITEIDNTAGNEYVFTLTNNNPYTVDVRYELDTTPPSANEITLTEGETSSNITLSVDDDVSYTLFAQSVVREEYVEEFFNDSDITNKPFTTPEILFVTLGVEWDQDTDSLTRLDDAVGLTSGGDFDGFNHYQLRRCMVNDDLSINYYIDPTDPTKIGEVVNAGTYTTGNNADYTGSHGQVMVEIPKFWWKYDEPTSDQYQWRISDTAQAGYDVHPAFITDSVTKDYIYMGAFEGGVDGSTLTSVSGVSVVTDGSTDSNTAAFPSNVGTGNGRIGDFRIAAQNRGNGWQMQTYWGTHALQMLYLIEYANFDSQTTIGRGVVDLTSFQNAINTGDTISLGNASGAASGTDGDVSISYRGVENLWGNIKQWIDGLNINNGEAFVANENFVTNVFSGDYTSVGVLASPGGYTSDIQFPHFLATALSGSDTSFLHDRFELNSSDEKVPQFGGPYSVGSQAGLFYIAMGADDEGSYKQTGSRLQIL